MLVRIGGRGRDDKQKLKREVSHNEDAMAWGASMVSDCEFLSYSRRCDICMRRHHKLSSRKRQASFPTLSPLLALSISQFAPQIAEGHLFRTSPWRWVEIICDGDMVLRSSQVLNQAINSAKRTQSGSDKFS